jgi:acetylornithine deacetylase/succinyl-diaminopimelate desuccinylase-like protein
MTEARLRDEVVELTRALIRVDTSNLPGNETPAAELLADYLQGAGVEPELVGPDPARLNLVARVPGRGDAPSLMLMAYTDIAPAPDADWSVPPFEAELRTDA